MVLTKNTLFRYYVVTFFNNKKKILIIGAFNDPTSSLILKIFMQEGVGVPITFNFEWYRLAFLALLVCIGVQRGKLLLWVRITTRLKCMCNC